MKLYVVWWEYWNGDERGGGGFNWYYTEEDALKAFEDEKECWKGWPATIRLTPLTAVPCRDPREFKQNPFPRASKEQVDRAFQVAQDKVTRWLIDHPDLYEYTPGTSAPALKVAITGG